MEEEQKGAERAEYGKHIIEQLSQELTFRYGAGFSARYLRAFRKFYIVVPNFEIWKSRFPNLQWTHVFRALRVGDETAIRWYLEMASQEMWSVRTLDRNISTQYFERHFSQSQLVMIETELNKLELLKNPIVAEFLGFKQDNSFSEQELETAIIDHLQEFIMELGRGFAFMGRQKLVRTDTQDYFIDLVFYNFKMKRFVIFELKTHRLSHQDIGQLDMYVRMYDDLVKGADDLPTIGVLLCTDTDNTIARYSVLHESEQIFAAKYMTYMPTEEELRQEIEQQKQFFLEQHKG